MLLIATCRPRTLLVLDEPYASVDVEGIAEMNRVIEQQLATGAIIILSSHQQLEIFDFPIRNVNFLQAKGHHE